MSNNYPDLSNAIVPEALVEEKKPLLVKSGITRIVEIGRVHGTPKITTTALGYKVCLVYIHVGATVNRPNFSPQIEIWRITGDEWMKQAKEELKPGMVVAIEGERRTFILSSRSSHDTFQHVNVAKKISILDQRQGMKEAYKKEFIAYDNCFKNDG